MAVVYGPVDVIMGCCPIRTNKIVHYIHLFTLHRQMYWTIEATRNHVRHLLRYKIKSNLFLDMGIFKMQLY